MTKLCIEGDLLMFILYDASEIFDKLALYSKDAYSAYIKEQNMKVLCTGDTIFFVELDSSISYEFEHSFRGGNLASICRRLFKIDDLDLALYLLKHTYHRALDHDFGAGAGYAHILQHPQYTQYINTDDFSLQIDRWGYELFSPFIKEKEQNLNTRITTSKLIKAILAGQIDKVICNGNCTDNWANDAEHNNWRGEWDVLDFAEKLWFARDSKGFYLIDKKENKLEVWHSCREFSESYTVYLK